MSNQNHEENFVMSQRNENNHISDAEEDYYDIDDHDLRKKPTLFFIIAGVIALVIVIFLVILLTRTSSEADPKQIQAIETRIRHLEDKMTIVDGIDKTFNKFRQQEKDIALLSARIQQLETNLTKQINQIAQQLSNVATTPSSTPPSKATTTAAAKPAEKETSVKFHEVRRGETLYGIGRRYGLTVDQMRKYNNLAPNATIYPGQKLKVSPDGGN